MLEWKLQQLKFFFCPLVPILRLRVHPALLLTLELQHVTSASIILRSSSLPLCRLSLFPEVTLSQQSFRTASPPVVHPKVQSLPSYSMAVAFLSNSPASPRQPSRPPFSRYNIYACLSLLSPNNPWVVGGVWQCSILAVVEETVAPTAITDQEQGSQEDQGTDGAGLSLQQEAEQVEAHKHGVVEPQCWVQRLGNEQHRQQPL